MKKLFLLAFLCVALSVAAVAQNRGGVHVAFGSEVEQLALGLNGEFFVAEKVSIAPELNIFFPDRTTTDYFGVKTTSSYSTWSISGDVHYYFINDEKIGFYGIAGLGLAVARGRVKVVYPNQPTQENSNSNSELGLNLGVGANFPMPGKVTPFGQLKYETSYEQLLLQAGIRFTLK
jgi:outer membrane protein X